MISKSLLIAGILWAVGLYGQSLAEGQAEMDAGRLEEAERILIEVVRAQPDSAEGRHYLGLMRFRAGRAVPARADLEQAAKLAQGNALAWKMLGLVTTSAGDRDGALMPLGRACELDPRDEESCYYLARTLFDLAIRAAKRATLAVALNYIGLGIAAEAERHFLKAIQTGGGAEDPRADYGAFLFRQGRVQDALAPLRQAVRDAPASARANVELGRVLLHPDGAGEATACLQRVVGRDPRRGRKRCAWAAALRLLNRYISIPADVQKLLPDAARPVNFNGLRDCRLAEPEEDCPVAGTAVACRGGYAVPLAPPRGNQMNERAESIAVASRARQLQRQPMIAGGRCVAE